MDTDKMIALIQVSRFRNQEETWPGEIWNLINIIKKANKRHVGPEYYGIVLS